MITLKTFVGAENTAEDDSTLYKKAIENGIIEGCNFTKSGDNQINISDGYICFRGRNIQVVSESHLATLATSGTKQGALYLNLDIENHTKPIELISEIGKTSFTENQLLLATYTATALTISDLTVVCDRILDARKNNIQVVKNSEPKTTDDINKNFIVGDSWVVPNITFNNLIKNGDDVRVSDWVVEPTASLEKWNKGFKLTINGSMGSYAGAIQNTNIDVIAGHTYFAKFNRKMSLHGEYLELTIKAGNTEIFKKTVENTSDLNALKVFGTFVAPQNASGKLSYEFGFGNYVIGEDPHPIGGITYIEEITLIDLTEDMTDLDALDLSQCDSYFFGKTFKTNHYEKSGIYYCLSNIQNNAKWEKTNNDYIIEKGLTDGWTWEKWASGKATCWGSFTISSLTNIVPPATGISELYIRYANVTLPFEFIGNYVATGSINWYATEWIGVHRENSTEIGVRIFGGSTINNQESYNLSFNVVGSWK
ncbi:MAG: hypothetical protein ACOYJ1_16105 [Peptococcales bacterium]|jgi:hypothetical protein